MSQPFGISADDVLSAAQLLSGVAALTPLLEFASLNERIGARVLVKFEGAQHTGSFKFRGAYNRLARIPEAQRAAGVVAWSSGNHAQGVAAAAKRLGLPATIVMPADAPAIKLANTKALGAEVVPYNRLTESREQIAFDIARKRGAVVVPSFDDPFVMAGQGTIGFEVLDQARAAGVRIGRLLVPCGGGGLLAGIATAVKDQSPATHIYAVEPAAFDDTARSLHSGKRETIAKGAASICDALQTPSPGELTFPILKHFLAGGLTVSDDQVKAAMRFAFEKMKLVVEPGGAVALAAALHGLVPGDDTMAIVISGSNVDPDTYAAILNSH